MKLVAHSLQLNEAQKLKSTRADEKPLILKVAKDWTLNSTFTFSQVQTQMNTTGMLQWIRNPSQKRNP